VRRPRAAPARARPNAVAALHRQIGNRAVAATLQRAVGFEFEDSSWRPWRRGWFGRLYPVERQRVMHRGTGFELQADDSPGPTRSNIEFVTKPFEETKTGLRELRQTMREVRTLLTNQFDPNVGQPGPANAGGNPPFRFDATRLLAATALGLTGSRDLPANQTYFSRGQAGGRFKLQATAGIALDKLGPVLEYLGTNPRGETAAQTLERTPARTALYRSPVPQSYLRVLGNARALAGDVLQAMSNDVPNFTAGERAHFATGPQALSGFIASVMATMKLLQMPIAGVIKYRSALMPRTSYAAMFASLVPADRAGIVNNPGRFAHHMVAVSNANPLLAAMGPINPDTGLTVADAFIRAAPADPSQGVFGAITIGDWIEGMTRGRDFLMPADMDAELRRRHTGRAGRRTARDLLESFGTIGVMDVRGGAPGLAVFEQRAIAPGVWAAGQAPDLNINEVYKIVWNQLVFFRQVRRAANAAAIGQYPNRRRGSVP